MSLSFMRLAHLARSGGCWADVSPGGSAGVLPVNRRAAGARQAALAVKSLAFLMLSALAAQAQGPVITQQPTNETVMQGATVALSVSAVGARPFTYLWFFDGALLTNGNGIGGANAVNLTISNLFEFVSPPATTNATEFFRAVQQ